MNSHLDRIECLAAELRGEFTWLRGEETALIPAVLKLISDSVSSIDPTASKSQELAELMCVLISGEDPVCFRALRAHLYFRCLEKLRGEASRIAAGQRHCCARAGDWSGALHAIATSARLRLYFPWLTAAGLLYLAGFSMHIDRQTAAILKLSTAIS